MYAAGFSAVARRQADKVSAWWYSHRSLASTLFDDELDAVVDLVRRHPRAGEAVRVRGVLNARRMVLPKTGYIVIYVVNDARGEVIVERVRHAKRRPLLRLTG